MKYFIFVLLIGLASVSGLAQSETTAGKFGFALNSSLNGEVYPLRLVPSITYLNRNTQLELGAGVHPFFRKDQTIVSGEFNVKYFPNGTEQKFNMYLITSLSYLHNPRKTYYPTTYNYLFLHGGYGFQLNLSQRAYMGTNMSVGTFSYSKRSEIPYDSFAKQDLFETFGFVLAFQFNVGYRF